MSIDLLSCCDHAKRGREGSPSLPHCAPVPLTRRQMLTRMCAGFGLLGLANLLNTRTFASPAPPAESGLTSFRTPL